MKDGKLYYWNIDSESNPIFGRDGWDSRLYYNIGTLTAPAVPSSPISSTSQVILSTPTATPSPAKQPTPAPTASPTIHITDIKKSSSIPIWIWIVLPVAIIGAGLIVFLIKKKYKSKDE